jgi:hypothetical protein
MVYILYLLLVSIWTSYISGVDSQPHVISGRRWGSFRYFISISFFLSPLKLWWVLCVKHLSLPCGLLSIFYVFFLSHKFVNSLKARTVDWLTVKIGNNFNHQPILLLTCYSSPYYARAFRVYLETNLVVEVFIPTNVYILLWFVLEGNISESEMFPWSLHPTKEIYFT